MKKKITGVYGIFDLDTDQCLYVGQSVDVNERLRKHNEKLLAGKHPRKEMQQWFDGEGNQAYSLILEHCEDTDDAKNSCEIKWFCLLNPLFYGVAPTVNNTWSHSEKTRKRISESLLGKNHDERYNKCQQCGKNCKQENVLCSHCIKSNESIRKRELKIQKEKETYKKIIVLHKKGVSITDICKECDVSYDVVNRIILMSNLIGSPSFSHELERDQFIIASYKQGESLRNIASKIGISHVSVYKILKSNNVLMRESNKSVSTQEELEEAIKLYEMGLSNVDIAQRLEVSVSSVQRTLSSNGYSKVKDRVNRDKEILKMHSDGASNKEIGEAFGLAERSVRSILHKNGATKKSSSQNVDDEIRSKVKELYLNNVSNSDIAQQLQLTPAQVKHAVHKSGAGAIRRKQIAEKHNRIVDLYSHGLTIKDIAGKVDMQYKSMGYSC